MNNGGIDTRGLEERAERDLKRLREQIDDASERLVGFIRERPGASILIALGAGFLIGRILRS